MAFEFCAELVIDEFVEDLRLNHFEKAPNKEDVIVSNCKECKLYEKALIPVPTFSGPYSDVHLWFLMALNCEFRKHLHKPSKKAPEGPQSLAPINVCNMWMESEAGKKYAEEALFLKREKEKIERSEDEKFRKIKSFVLDCFEFEPDYDSEAETIETEYDSEPEYDSDSEHDSKPEFDSEFEYDSDESQTEDDYENGSGSASVPVFALAAPGAALAPPAPPAVPVPALAVHATAPALGAAPGLGSAPPALDVALDVATLLPAPTPPATALAGPPFSFGHGPECNLNFDLN